MSDTSGWWAKRLGGGPQRPQPQPQAYQPQQYQAPQGTPYQQQEHGAVGAYAQQLERLQPNGAGQVTTENIFEMARFWKGGPGHKNDPDPCPECGSNQYFSRRARHSRLPPPAPHCYNCGFNGGLFEQGDPTTWGAEA